MKMFKAFPLCLTLSLVHVPLSAQNGSGVFLDHVPKERLELLAHGINLNAWFTTWANPATFADRFTPQEAAFLKRAGFTVCRLPLAPDLLFDPENPAQPKAAIRFVDHAVRVLLDAGLAVVFDPIHGPSDTAQWESELDHDPAFLAKAETYWETLAKHYAALSTDKIFFEIMNEPHLSDREKVEPSWWPPVQEALAAAIRRGAASNTIIATGERWGGIDGLVALKPLNDRNVVYSFHWYEPFTFTHQGAEWTGPTQAELSGIPYPSSPESVAARASSLTDPKAARQVVDYGKELWNKARVFAGLARAADWAKANNVPVFCGEFGVYRKVAPVEDRLRWIHDVRESLESLGIGWSMWDYETDFGLVTYSEPSWRRGLQVDAGCLKALGLDASQTLVLKDSGPTLADFVSRKVESLDIPANSWSGLWTREQGAGLATADEPGVIELTFRGAQDWSLGSGLRVPVEKGEKIRLSSSASLKGAGSLRLEFVARDEAGKVLDWGYGSVEAGSGVGLPVAASILVASGVATLEPRWSGKGPIEAELKGFVLERLVDGQTPVASPRP